MKVENREESRERSVEGDVYGNGNLIAGDKGCFIVTKKTTKGGKNVTSKSTKCIHSFRSM